MQEQEPVCFQGTSDQQVTSTNMNGSIASHCSFSATNYKADTNSTITIKGLNPYNIYQLEVQFSDIFQLPPQYIYTYKDYTIVGASFVYEVEPNGFSPLGDHVTLASRRFSGCDVGPDVDERPVIGERYVISVEQGSRSVLFRFQANNDTEEGRGFQLSYQFKG